MSNKNTGRFVLNFFIFSVDGVIYVCSILVSESYTILS